jgi:diketogulonate reductase-like aldo/keto reductase
VTLAKIGFGTANLMGRINLRQSLRLMDTAFDAGIRHFDTAPLYGLGAAEGMVGEFAANKRAEITIATKFGIRPPNPTPRMVFAKAAARMAVKVAPSLRTKLRRRAEAMTTRGSFTPEECRASLHRSLLQLRTDYIDLFLMHEVLPDQISIELLQTLEDVAKVGRIRAFGVATSARVAAALADTMAIGRVAQFPSSVFSPMVSRIPNHLVKITHSALGADFLALYKGLSADKGKLNKWSTALDLNCSDSDELGRLFLYAAMRENATGTVMFSSLNPERIRRNAALADGSSFSAGQVELLQKLVKTERGEGRQVLSQTI